MLQKQGYLRSDEPLGSYADFTLTEMVEERHGQNFSFKNDHYVS